MTRRPVHSARKSFKRPELTVCCGLMLVCCVCIPACILNCCADTLAIMLVLPLIPIMPVLPLIPIMHLSRIDALNLFLILTMHAGAQPSAMPRLVALKHKKLPAKGLTCRTASCLLPKVKVSTTVDASITNF